MDVFTAKNIRQHHTYHRQEDGSLKDVTLDLLIDDIETSDPLNILLALEEELELNHI